MSITPELLDRLLIHAVDHSIWAHHTIGWCEFYVLGKKLLREDDFMDICQYPLYTQSYLETIYKDRDK